MKKYGIPIYMVDTRRPCIKRKTKEKCFFHLWSHESRLVDASPMIGGHPGGNISETLGILEFEDGHIETLPPSEFYFCDGGDFGNVVWVGEEQNE